MQPISHIAAGIFFSKLKTSLKLNFAFNIYTWHIRYEYFILHPNPVCVNLLVMVDRSFAVLHESFTSSWAF